MSRYHAASRTVLAGIAADYEQDILSVLVPVYTSLIRYSNLLIHRIIEMYRWAAICHGIKENGECWMTDSPETAMPDDTDGHNLRKYTDRQMDMIERKIDERATKTKGMYAELHRIGTMVDRVRPWLMQALDAFALHLEEIEKAGKNKQLRRNLDRDENNRLFAEPPPKLRANDRPLFRDNPEAERSLEDWLSIYRHGSHPRDLNPLRLHKEFSIPLNELDKAVQELKRYTPGQWARSRMDSSTLPDIYDTITDLLSAMDAVTKQAETELEDAEAEVREVRIKHAIKKHKLRLHIEWGEKFKHLKDKEFDFRRGVEKVKRWYKRDSLGRFAPK